MDDITRTYVTPPDTLPKFPDAKPAKRKGHRKRWYDPKKKKYYEWDYQHGKVERYNNRGKHEGEFDPDTGDQTKPADPKRTITPSKKEAMKTTSIDQAYLLGWYNKNPSSAEDELRLGAEQLSGITIADVRRWFGLDANDPACFCYDLTASQIAEVQKYVEHRIDLDKYDYSLDCYDPNR